MFFKAGVFVRADGGVKQIARTLSFDEAVVYAVWEDPAATYPFNGSSVRPGVTCAMLVPSSDPEGPPWMPLQAVVSSGQSEIESGILSPWLDQVACARFKPALTLAKSRLNVATDASAPVLADRSALGETLRWLAANKAERGLLARAARTMLVDSGHGLQRYGVSLMGASDDEKRAAIDEVLAPLAPDVAAVLAPLWETWLAPAALRRSDEQPDALLALAAALEKNLSADAPLQSPLQMAALVTWLAGLFGSRAERTGRQPARTLHAVIRAIRGASRQLKALKHADSTLPRLPLDRAENAELVRELSHAGRNETPLENLVRALAIAESGWYIARPRRDHLRPFRAAYDLIRGYPNASRSLVGRFDYIFSAWSFRGAELRDEGVPERALAGVFITNSPSITSTRAFARVVATESKTGGYVSQGLKSLDHPTLTRVGELRDMEDSAVAALYEDAVSHDRMTWLRLQTGIAAAEYLIARSEQGAEIEGFALRPPGRPRESGTGLRGHFMYWRMFCRSVAWKLPDVYRTFVDELEPHILTLPPKLQTEVFALTRRWGLHSAENREHVAGWAGWLGQAADAYFAAEDRTWLDGEWLEALSGALAVADVDATVSFLERLAADDAFPVGQVDRILDAIRAAGWQRDLVELPVFRALHTRLVDERSVHGIRARVQWTRAALDRAKHSESVRWLLDVRAYPRALGSVAFDAWFQANGAKAIADPNSAVVELLELAIGHVSGAHLDIALRALMNRTEWPEEQRLAALTEAGRPDAVVALMRAGGAADSAAHGSAVATLFDATSGAELRAAGVAVAEYEAIHGADETAAILQDGLASAFERYTPFRFALDGFVAALDGWRVAGLGTRNPAAALLTQASRWALETGDERLIAFAGAVVDTAVATHLEVPLNAALGGDDAALGGALLGLRLPEVASESAELAGAGGKKATARSLRARLAGAGCGDVIDAAVAGAVARQLDAGTSAADVATRLAQLASMAKPSAEPGPVDAPVADAEVAEEDATETEAVAAPEVTSDPPPTAADRATQRLREEVGSALASALARWSNVARRLEGMGPAGAALLARATRFAPADHALRAELFAPLGRSGATVKDPRRVLTTDFLDGLTQAVDQADFVAIADSLATAVATHADGAKEITVDRNAIAFPLPKVSSDLETIDEEEMAPAVEPIDDEDHSAAEEGASEVEGVDAEASAPEAASESEQGAEDADADGAAEPQAETADTESAAPAEATPEPQGPSLKTRFRDGYAADADVDARSVFGDPSVPVLVRHLARRNGLAIKVGSHRKRQAITLQWDRRRR